MKFVGYVTVRLNSTRVPGKSVVEVGGHPLIDRTIHMLNRVPEIDKTILYCSNEKIMDYIDKQRSYEFRKRDIKFDGDKITFNNILDSLIDDLGGYTHIVFVCCTSPFLRPETISGMINRIGFYDSAFTVTEHRTFSWFKGKPLNYKLAKYVPRTQELNPIYLETSSAYIFSIDYYKKTGRRIGTAPYIKVVDVFEGWDIDTQQDMEIAQQIAKLVI